MQALRIVAVAIAAGIAGCGGMSGTVGVGKPWSIEQDTAEYRALYLDARPGDLLLITVDSGNLSSQLTVAFNGNTIGSSKNDYGPSTMWLMATLPGKYTVHMYSNARKYSVTVQRGVPAASAPVEGKLAIAAPVRGVLELMDARSAKNYATDVYTFDGTEGQEVEFRMDSDEFNTFVAVKGPGLDASNDDDKDRYLPWKHSRLLVTLPETATYRVEASSQGGLGGYQLAVVTGAASRADLARAKEILAQDMKHEELLKQAAIARIPQMMEEANAVLEAGDNYRANDLYQAIRSLDPDYVPAIFNQGVAAVRARNWLLAKWCAEDVLKLQPGNTAARQVWAAADAGEKQQQADYQRKLDEDAQYNANLLNFALMMATPALTGGQMYPAPAPNAPAPAPSARSTMLQAVADTVLTRPMDIRVDLLEFGGDASRTRCLRGQLEPGRGASSYRENHGRGNSDWVDAAVYVVENTCQEPVVAYGAACMDVVMQQSKAGYLAGAQAGLLPDMARNTLLQPGQKLVLGYQGKQPLGDVYRDPKLARVDKVAFGALSVEGYRSGAATDQAAWYDRAWAALNRAVGAEPGYALAGKEVNVPSQWQLGSCGGVSFVNP